MMMMASHIIACAALWFLREAALVLLVVVVVLLRLSHERYRIVHSRSPFEEGKCSILSSQHAWSLGGPRAKFGRLCTRIASIPIAQVKFDEIDDLKGRGMNKQQLKEEAMNIMEQDPRCKGKYCAKEVETVWKQIETTRGVWTVRERFDVWIGGNENTHRLIDYGYDDYHTMKLNNKWVEEVRYHE